MNAHEAVPRLRVASWFAAQSLGAAGQRALLALLGVAVGVAAVVALVQLGQGAARKAREEFRHMGTQVITSAWEDNDTADRKTDGSAVIEAVGKLPEVELFSEVLRVPCPVAAGMPSMVLAVRAELQDILGLTLAQGRFIHPLDTHDVWVVLGARVAQQLRKRGERLQPGAALALCGRVVRLAGVLAPAGTPEAASTIQVDHAVLVSIALGRRLHPAAPLEQLALRVRPDVSPTRFAPRLTALLKDVVHRDVDVRTATRVLELRQRQAATTTRFLASLAGLSLLIGSLGILNVMLMAVVQRRQEIGLRMAVGAGHADIALQFLFESTLLALGGGAAGVVLGQAGAAVAAHIAGLPFVFTASSAAFALLASLAVGITSGLYPAMKAARMAPAQALRAA